jgi:hypothetical protein
MIVHIGSVHLDKQSLEMELIKLYDLPSLSAGWRRFKMGVTEPNQLITELSEILVH